MLRELIESKSMHSYETKDKKVAWVSDGHTVVFGRWQGLHPDGSSKIAGRLDGCDRLWNGAANLCVTNNVVAKLADQGIRLFLADGPTLAKPALIRSVESLGVQVHFVELDVPPEVAVAQWKQRDGSDLKEAKGAVWPKLKSKWKSHPGWQTMSTLEAEAYVNSLVEA